MGNKRDQEQYLGNPEKAVQDLFLDPSQAFWTSPTGKEYIWRWNISCTLPDSVLHVHIKVNGQSHIDPGCVV
ncbi:hypothetical protein DUI87_05663 [Hirundo rustica rustica]|uniref:Uncharacterized protein n=1 Tax=Hirundo rustica rustica TaxID=333673 RepID=A0A3M0KWA1_HIRRU|nr:hypothetical protein DUI87_05663 [Hirundo rustica rustica]